jgi:hypothetical protein
MTKKKDSDKTASYWDDVWGKPKDYQSSGIRKFLFSKNF